MGPMSTTTLQKTPFHKYHVEHGAKLVDYTGWEMPLLYTSILEEHRQVCERGGLFDVSHMGRFTFKGRDAPGSSIGCAPVASVPCRNARSATRWCATSRGMPRRRARGTPR